jgi:hypothetical protein
MEMAIVGIGKAVWAVITDNRLVSAIGGIVTILTLTAKLILSSKEKGIVRERLSILQGNVIYFSKAGIYQIIEEFLTTTNLRFERTKGDRLRGQSKSRRKE